jgi:peptide/nickel transport system permease protein
VVAPAIVLGVLAVGTNMYADAIARANLGDDHSEVFELTASLPQEQADDH